MLNLVLSDCSLYGNLPSCIGGCKCTVLTQERVALVVGDKLYCWSGDYTSSWSEFLLPFEDVRKIHQTAVESSLSFITWNGGIYTLSVDAFEESKYQVIPSDHDNY